MRTICIAFGCNMSLSMCSFSTGSYSTTLCQRLCQWCSLSIWNSIFSRYTKAFLDTSEIFLIVWFCGFSFGASSVTGPCQFDYVPKSEHHWHYWIAVTILATHFASRESKIVGTFLKCILRSLFDAVVLDFRHFSNLSVDNIQMITIAIGMTHTNTHSVTILSWTIHQCMHAVEIETRHTAIMYVGVFVREPHSYTRL